MEDNEFKEYYFTLIFWLLSAICLAAYTVHYPSQAKYAWIMMFIVFLAIALKQTSK